MGSTDIKRIVRLDNGKWVALDENGEIEYEARTHAEVLSHYGIGRR